MDSIDLEQINNSVEPNQKLYIACFVLGILTIVTAIMMTVYIPFVLGGVGIILGILSKGQLLHLPKQAEIGISAAIVGLVLNIVIMVSSFYTVFTNPEAYSQFNSTFEQVYGESFEDALVEMGIK